MAEPKGAVRVTCQGAGLLKLGDIKPFQGNLKDLPEENYEKLRDAILKHGFSFPFFIWKDGDKNYCLDGHQRDKVLRRMRKDGYTIPELPVAYVEAKDEKTAKEKLLLAASVYGKVNVEGLEKFIKSSGIDLSQARNIIDLPEIDLTILEIDSSYRKGEGFESIVDQFGQQKKSDKDGNWLYVEYYGKNAEYKRVKGKLLMKTSHEVDPKWFAGLVAQHGLKAAAKKVAVKEGEG